MISWPTIRLKFLSTEPMKYGANEEASDTDPEQPRFVRITDISEDGGLRPDTFRSLPWEAAQDFMLQDGDVLFARSGATVGKTFRYDASWGQACFAGYLIRFRSDKGKLLPAFLGYFAQSVPYWDQISASTIQATIQNFSAEKYGDLTLIVPPIPAQELLVTFLNEEIGRIDHLIHERERMLELLAEKRAALVTEAVTRGLDSTVRLKPSGLDWVGDIPAHWRVLKLKYVSAIGNGSTPNIDNLDYWDGGDFPWLNSSVVGERPVKEPSRLVTEIALSECHLPRVEPPALLVAITGQGKTRGRSTVLEFEATINQHLAYVKSFSDAAESYYLSHLFDTAYAYLRSDSDGAGSTRGAITCEQLGNFLLPLPPLTEQHLILRHIERSLEH